VIETPTEETPPTAPLERHQYLEVDAFCTNCGYNLHAQPVTRDARLGIFVCRCPECGQHHPAGVGVTASSVWMRRIASGLLVFWVLVVLNAFFWLSVAFGGLIITHIEVLTTTEMVAPDGRLVEYIEVPPPAAAGGAAGGAAAMPAAAGTSWVPVYKGTTQPVQTHERVRTTNFPNPNPNPNQPVDWRLRYAAINAMTAACIALVGGVLLVVFLWHWPRRRYLLVMLIPFVAAAGALGLMWLFDAGNEYRNVRGWMTRSAAAYAALGAASLGVGILIGRPIARGLLRMFIPPKPRQHFNFMWHIDGKAPPAAKPTT
jgi:hypothetical protein